jgi:alpha-L-fucosidase 2
MRRASLLIPLVSCWLTVVVPVATRADEGALKLWYDAPAKEWLEAVPLGNGHLGAMVFGGVGTERFQLNESTLWAGGPKDWNTPGAREALPEVRRLIFEGKFAEAHQACKKLMGPYTQSYLPMADLTLESAAGAGESTVVSGYERSLDLPTATATTRYTIDGVTYEREAFVSHPDGVLAVRLTASRPGGLSLTARLSSKLKAHTEAHGEALALVGKAPMHADPVYHKTAQPMVYAEDASGEGMNFVCLLGAQTVGGRTVVTADGLRIEGATSAVLVVSAATSFHGFDRSPGRDGLDPWPLAEKRLAAAQAQDFATLKNRHVSDHRSLFDRVAIDLGQSPEEAKALPTDRRMKAFGAKDPGLVALHFQYGRYLMIAGSRPGGQPLNLQGMWNDELFPPWSSNYTVNINTEMNYWPAQATNLAECEQPLYEMIRELSITGHETARVNYGCGGWVSHHNVDLWRQSAPVGGYGNGDATWAIWPMSGPWLCQHLWRKYVYDGDETFLRDFSYPVMKGAAEFCLDFLVDDGKGHLVTAPSTSPENQFVGPDGKRSAVSQASTMDLELIHDLFGHCIAASKILGIDEAFRARLEASLAKLYPIQIGPDGRLQEWFQPFKETEPHHRHLSHLFGAYPGDRITRATPELMEAVKQSLLARSDVGTGWSTGWKINLWARLGDGDHAFSLVERTLRLGPGGVYANLFGSHPPFQMDGNFAFPAGVCEMLLQGHEDGGTTIRLLPALPKAWPTGSVRGLRAPGGFEVDVEWKDGARTGAVLRSRLGRTAVVRCGEQRADITTAKDQEVRLDGALKVVD